MSVLPSRRYQLRSHGARLSSPSSSVTIVWYPPHNMGLHSHPPTPLSQLTSLQPPQFSLKTVVGFSVCVPLCVCVSLCVCGPFLASQLKP